MAAGYINHAAETLADDRQEVESSDLLDDGSTGEFNDYDTDDAMSDTASILSSIFSFRQENGFTYHSYKDGKYLLPNTERENDRLDLQHTLFLHTLDGRLGLAPPAQPGSRVRRVLDVGTGTGLWAIDFGDEHPDAQVIGFDLSPSQPSMIPPNVSFEIADLDDIWEYRRRFDYIHSRSMALSVSDWPELVRKAYNHLTPGGYLELQEIDMWAQSNDGTLQPTSELLRGTQLLEEGIQKSGRCFAPCEQLPAMLEAAGFEDVRVEVFAWPTNPWPRETRHKILGAWSQENAVGNISGLYMAALTRGHDWKPEQVEVFLVGVRKEIMDRSIHAYWPVHIVYGRKPDDGSKSVSSAGSSIKSGVEQGGLLGESGRGSAPPDPSIVR